MGTATSSLGKKARVPRNDSYPNDMHHHPVSLAFAGTTRQVGAVVPALYNR